MAKLKKIAKRSAEQAWRELATHADTPYPASRAAGHKTFSEAMLTHIDGLKPLVRSFNKLRLEAAMQSDIDRKKLAEAALKRGRTRKSTLASMIKQRAHSFELLASAVPVPSAPRYFVNTPIDIYGTAINFDAFAAVPSNSWVKFRMEAQKTPTTQYASVNFAFVWDNASDKYVVINANGYLILHGQYDNWSDGGIFVEIVRQRLNCGRLWKR